MGNSERETGPRVVPLNAGESSSWENEGKGHDETFPSTGKECMKSTSSCVTAGRERGLGSGKKILKVIEKKQGKATT